MDIKYFPEQLDVNMAIVVDALLLILISFDGEITIVADIDYDYNDDIVLRFQDYSKLEVVEKNFRVVLNRKGAEWSFYCPSNYKGIQDKNMRYKQYYSDGIKAIKETSNRLFRKLSSF